LACLVGFKDSALDQTIYGHSACTKHLRRFQLIQLSTIGTLTLAVDLDSMIAAKSSYTCFVPGVVPARTFTPLDSGCLRFDNPARVWRGL
jgi:hypothetical protein